MGPRQFMLLGNIAREVIGTSRDSLFADFRDLQADFEIISDDGAVVIFTSSVDNGTGDSILRTE